MEGRQKRMKVIFMNAQSICNKIDELKVVVAENEPDILAICETWTNDNVGNAVLGIEDYVIAARKDRNDTAGGRGGGLLVYVRKDMYVWQVTETTNFNQCVTISIKCGGENVNVHSVYRSPNSNRENDEKLNNWIVEMRGSNILIGDFNYPDVDWESGSSGARGREFLKATLERGLEQHVVESTHVSGNVLDLILCDREGLIDSVRALGRLGKSDHEMIAFEVKVDPKRAGRQRASLNYAKANFSKMRTALAGEEWNEMDGMDVNGMWIFVKERIQRLIERDTPVKKPRKNSRPPWMNSEILRSIAAKRRAWKKWKESGREGDGDAYRAKDKETKKMIRKRKNEWERRVVEKRVINPKLFYSHINRARKTRDSVAPLKNDEGQIIVEPQKQADVLNRYYAQVFTRSDVAPPDPRRKTEAKIEKIVVTKLKVMAAIDGLKRDAAPGPDEIPPCVFHELKEELAEPLVKLFRKSMETCRIPDEWRDATIVPIYKQKGSRTDPGNYRPVSLTSVAGKLLERVVKNELTTHVESNGLMSESQHGFRSGRSVQTNMIDFLNKTTKWLDEGRSFDVVYMDFAKAFDKVCHRRLLVKLEEFGILGEVLNWLEDWLSGRRQQVRVEGEYSSWEDVISSVLQGSVLGGLLFNIFVDDVDDLDVVEDVVEDESSLMASGKFADDTKVARVTENQADVDRMQEIINSLSKWADKWAMSFNASKCKVMHFGTRNPRARYVMNGVELGETVEERDLGIQIVNTLKPSRQCAIAAKTAHFALSQIQRAFHFRRARDLVPLYKTFVRPRLEFGIAAWNPWTEADIQCLEAVQKRLVRLLSDVTGESYEEKLRVAGLTTLRDRRERGDAIEVFKTLKRMNNIDVDRWFKVVGESARPLRSNTLVEGGDEVRKENVLEIERCNLEIRKNFFVVRAAKTWNEIPEEVKKATSLNGFKNAYDAWRVKKSCTNTNPNEDAAREDEHDNGN